MGIRREIERKREINYLCIFLSSLSLFYTFIVPPSFFPELDNVNVIGDFYLNHIELSHSEDLDKFEKHKTLKLIDIVPELSGSYMCRVESLDDYDFKEVNMVVYCK